MQAAAPSMRGQRQVVDGNLNWATGDPGRDRPTTSRSASGRSSRAGSLTQEDVDGATKVALLGQTTA